MDMSRARAAPPERVGARRERAGQGSQTVEGPCATLDLCKMRESTVSDPRLAVSPLTEHRKCRERAELGPQRGRPRQRGGYAPVDEGNLNGALGTNRLRTDDERMSARTLELHDRTLVHNR